jgi:hypothetical protein
MTLDSYSFLYTRLCTKKREREGFCQNSRMWWLDSGVGTILIMIVVSCACCACMCVLHFIRDTLYSREHMRYLRESRRIVPLWVDNTRIETATVTVNHHFTVGVPVLNAVDSVA